MRIARISTITGGSPAEKFHVIPLHGGKTLCGEPVMESAIDPTVTGPTCQWCRESLRDLAIWMADRSTQDLTVLR
jgi:hypothetical protein